MKSAITYDWCKDFIIDWLKFSLGYIVTFQYRSHVKHNA